MMPEEAYLTIAYWDNWGEFDVARQFRTEAEAHDFAKSQITSSVVVVKGNVDEWFERKIGKPIAIYWRGERFIPDQG